MVIEVFDDKVGFFGIIFKRDVQIFTNTFGYDVVRSVTCGIIDKFIIGITSGFDDGGLTVFGDNLCLSNGLNAVINFYTDRFHKLSLY